jgi:hypothetical protein
MCSFSKPYKEHLDDLNSLLGRNRRSVLPRTRVSSLAILVRQRLLVWRKAADDHRLVQKGSGNR